MGLYKYVQSPNRFFNPRECGEMGLRTFIIIVYYSFITLISLYSIALRINVKGFFSKYSNNYIYVFIIIQITHVTIFTSVHYFLDYYFDKPFNLILFLKYIFNS